MRRANDDCRATRALLTGDGDARVCCVWLWWVQLEEVLMMADIGAATTGEIIDDLRAVAKEDQLDPEDVKSVLRGRLIDALSVQGRGMNLARQEGAEDQVGVR